MLQGQTCPAKSRRCARVQESNEDDLQRIQLKGRKVQSLCHHGDTSKETTELMLVGDSAIDAAIKDRDWGEKQCRRELVGHANRMITVLVSSTSPERKHRYKWQYRSRFECAFNETF